MPLALLGAPMLWLCTVSIRLWHVNAEAGFDSVALFTFWPPLDPCLRQGRGGAWDRRRREACRWLWHNGLFCTGFAIRTIGKLGLRFTSARGLKTWLFTVRAGFGTLGCVLTAFNPDVWPPSKPPRQRTAAAGCRLWHNGLCFNGFQSGRLAALKPSLAGYGCIRQPLPLLGASTGGVRLPLALLPQNLAFHRFRQALAQWAVF